MPSLEDHHRDWAYYKRLLSYLRRHKFVFVLSIIGYFLFALTGVATAQWLGWTINQIEENNIDVRILSPLLCVAIVFVRGVGGFVGNVSISHVANCIVHRLRCEIFTHLVDLPVNYYDRTTSGRIVSRLIYDVAQIAGASTSAITVILREGLTVIGLLTALFIADWKLSLLFLSVAPVVAKLVQFTSVKLRRYSGQIQNTMGDVTQVINESIEGHRILRSFSGKDSAVTKFESISNRNRALNMRMEISQSLSTPLIQLVVSLAMALLIWFSISPNFFLDKSSGEFVAFLTMAGLLAKPIRQLSQVNSVIQRGVAAAESIFTFLDESKETNSGTLEPETVKGELRFNNVDFSYNSNTKILKNISLLAKPGKTIALVGESGSGKSSLVNLISRFYEKDSGEILLDGVELREYTLENLRKHVSIVTQKVVLFDGTIAENIGYGQSPAASELQIVRAAKNAHAWNFIGTLKDGVHTKIGENATLLSGGQKQRIAIARAFLKDSPILILDEATSALDSESENQIQIALSTLMQGRTTFVIAHRLSTIESADLILVMSNGEIVEQGSHVNLIAKRSHYAKLHSLQFANSSNRVVL